MGFWPGIGKCFLDGLDPGKSAGAFNNTGAKSVLGSREIQTLLTSSGGKTESALRPSGGSLHFRRIRKKVRDKKKHPIQTIREERKRGGPRDKREGRVKQNIKIEEHSTQVCGRIQRKDPHYR